MSLASYPPKRASHIDSDSGRKSFFGDDDDVSLRFDPNIGGSGAMVFRDEKGNDRDLLELRRGDHVYVQTDFTVTGQTTTVDDVVLTDVDVQDSGGTTQVRIDGDAGTPYVDLRGTLLEGINEIQDQSDNVHLTVNDGGNLDVERTLNFPNITGTPTFAGHDHSSSGMTLVGISGLDDAGGLEGGGGGGVRVQGDAVAGSFLSEGTNPYQVTPNLGSGLEGDGSDNIRVNGGSVAGSGLQEGTNPQEVDVGAGTAIATDGTTVNVDPGDDEEIQFGADDDMSERYDSGNDDLRWEDNTNGSDRMALDRTSGDLSIDGNLTEGATL